MAQPFANNTTNNELPLGVVEVQDIHLSQDEEHRFIFAKSKDDTLTRRIWREKREHAKNKASVTMNVLMIAGNVISGNISGSDHKEIFDNFKEHDGGKSRY